MIKDDEIVVCFCSPATAKELRLPDTTAVVTGLLGGDEVVVAPKQEFLDWLNERNAYDRKGSSIR